MMDTSWLICQFLSQLMISAFASIEKIYGFRFFNLGLESDYACVINRTLHPLTVGMKSLEMNTPDIKPYTSC